MRNLSKLILILCVMLFTAEAFAGNYVLRNGLWWRNGRSYHRRLCRTSFGTCYKYYPANTAKPYDALKSQILDIVKENQRYQARIAESANEHNELLEFVDKLKTQGLLPEAYNLSPQIANPYRAYGATAQQNYNPYAQQGSTVYGYTDIAKIYGDVDLSVLYQRADRLATNAQQLAGQATADFDDLVKAEGQNRAAVAEILAQRDLILAAKPQKASTVISRRFTFHVEQEPNGKVKVTPADQQGKASSPKERLMLDFVAASCVKCHDAKKASGGVNMLQMLTFPDAIKKKVRDSLTRVHADKTKWMPRNAAGEPGPAVPYDTLMLFSDYLGGLKE